MSLIVTVNTPMVKKDVADDILRNAELFEGQNRQYSPQQIAMIFSLYNRAFGENKKDQGCGSCRRNVLNKLSFIYYDLKKRNTQ